MKTECSTCYGYGLWPYDAENVPLTEDEAEEGWQSDDCPECGQDNYYSYVSEVEIKEPNEVQEYSGTIEEFFAEME